MLNKFKSTKFYIGWVKLCNDMKPMTFWEKVDHLWTYYRIYIWVFLMAMVPVMILGMYINQQSKEVLVNGMMINVNIDPLGVTYLTSDYAHELGAKDGKQLVQLDYVEFGDPLDPENGLASYETSMMLISRVSDGLLDYMVLDKFAMEHYIVWEVYMDLREFFTQDELAALAAEDKLIYAQQDGQEERWPIAVDISDTAYAKAYVRGDGKTYFALSGSTSRAEMCRNIWERINNCKAKE